MNATKRTQNNFIIDAIGYLSFWILVSTGLLMKYVLLPGHSRGGNDPTSVMGLGRHDWGDVHFWASVVFASAIVIHLLLHWNWIVGVFQKFLKERSKKVMIPALVIPILLAFVPFLGFRGFGDEEEQGGRGRGRARTYSYTNAASQTEPSVIQTELHGTTVGSEGNESHDINSFKIRGRTTFEEIERATGVKIVDIARAMNLPDDLPKNERLSFLKETYGFEMETIRRIVEQLATKIER